MPTLRLFVFFVVAVSLTSCGVVDSAGEGVNEGPSVSTGTNQLSVPEQQVVALSSEIFSIEDDFGNIQSYSWTQTSGDTVEISNADQPQASFIAPTVLESEGVGAVKELGFELTVTDNFNESGSATLTVQVQSVNETPVAGNDMEGNVVDEGATVVIAVVGNDTDSDGTVDPATLQVVTSPVNGTAVANADGTISYTQNGSETLTDSLTYTVNDNEGRASNAATVSVSVTPVNDPPQITGQSPLSTMEEVPLALSLDDLVVADPDSTFPDGFSLLVRAGSNYSVSGNTITPSLNFDGVLSVAVVVDDGSEENAISAVFNLAVTVIDVNDPPVAVNDTGNVDEAKSVVVNVLENDTDVDGTIGPTTITIVTAPVNGTAVANTDGTIIYTHNGSETTSDSFTYTAQDDDGEVSNVATVTISVIQNIAPVAVNDVNNVSAGESISVNVVANDTDTDGAVNPATVVIATQPANGSAVVNSDGTVTYTHNGSATTSDSFTYTVQDNDGATSNVATVSLTITSLSSFDAQGAGCWTTPQEQALEANLADPQASASTLYSLISDGAKGTVTIIDPLTGEFRYQPHAQGARGVDSFSYQINDPLDELRTETATVIVHPRIMVLGDSISAGLSDAQNLLPLTGQRVGFRQPLYEALLDENYQVDLVGGQRDGAAVSGFDPDHEAHLDWTVAELTWGRNPGGSEGVFAWLEAEPADLVLVHAGSYGLTSSVDQISALLDEIDRWEASANGNPVTVVVARIIDREPSDENVSLFNANLEAMVLERTSNPDHPSYPDDVLVADLHGALSYPQDLADGMHPSALGYDKLADTWYRALTDNALLVRCP